MKTFSKDISIQDNRVKEAFIDLFNLKLYQMIERSIDVYGGAPEKNSSLNHIREIVLGSLPVEVLLQFR